MSKKSSGGEQDRKHYYHLGTDVMDDDEDDFEPELLPKDSFKLSGNDQQPLSLADELAIAAAKDNHVNVTVNNLFPENNDNNSGSNGERQHVVVRVDQPNKDETSTKRPPPSNWGGTASQKRLLIQRVGLQSNDYVTCGQCCSVS